MIPIRPFCHIEPEIVPAITLMFPIKPLGLSIRELLGERIMLTAHLMAQEKRRKAIRRE